MSKMREYGRHLRSYMIVEISGEQIYLIALCFVLVSETLSSTMFPVPGTIIKLGRYIAMGIVVCKIAAFDQFRIRTFWGIGLLLADTVLVKAATSYLDPLMWAAFVIGARDVSFEKILKVYLAVVGSIVCWAFCASLLDVIENLQYEQGDRGIRNSFGIIYSTDFAAHIFFLMLVFWYLNRHRLKQYYYIISAVIASLVYIFCNARLDVACMFFLIAGYFLLQCAEKRREYRKYQLKTRYRKPARWIEKYGIYSMPIAALVISALTLLYDPQNVVMQQLDDWLSLRLTMGKRGMSEYGIKMFGQYITMVGNGGSTKMPTVEQYFFIDCSYLYILLRCGLIFFAFMVGIYVICCRKYRKDYYFILTIALVSLNCMISHHILELAFNPFALALFAKLSQDEDRSAGKDTCQEIRITYGKDKIGKV